MAQITRLDISFPKVWSEYEYSLVGMGNPSFEPKQPYDTSQLRGLQLLRLNISDLING